MANSTTPNASAISGTQNWGSVNIALILLRFAIEAFHQKIRAKCTKVSPEFQSRPNGLQLLRAARASQNFKLPKISS
jgi:hypothetical protein